jgi:CHAT domain
VVGDVTDVHASMIAISHINDVAPAGAEAAIDAVLGGAITRRASVLRGELGITHFLPTLTSPLAAGCVLIVSLGDAETLTVDRLREVGTAIVDAAVTVGVRDLATVVHGAGSAGVDPEHAAQLLTAGVLDRIARAPGAVVLRELSIVERDPTRLDAIQRGVMAASASPRVHVYTETAPARRAMPPAAITRPDGAVLEHLRLGVTRAGPDLKLTVIGHEAFDQAELFPFPAKVAERLVGDLRQQVLAVEDPSHRALALRSVGDRLANAFLRRPSFDVAALLAQAPNDLLVLRLDNWTVDLPWELARVDGQPLALSTRFGRQLELSAVGRQAAFVAPHDRLEVLVVGDPTGDLPGAAGEADAVARLLGALPGAKVTTLMSDVGYADVSRELDTHNYDVFHYAGHARFDVLREDASGLVLADGLLTAQDLAFRTHLPRLFVANACHSAATGDVRLQEQAEASRATRNLVSGVLGAGARAFVGAMWEVDDQAAATFAAGLYNELVQIGESEGGTIGDAVRRGRQQIITSHGEGQPAWAAYALYGSPWRRAW